MATEYATSTNGATLTEQELFRRFLDAPVFQHSHKSTLVNNNAVSDETMRDHLFGLSLCTCAGIPEDLLDQIVDDLRDSDYPLEELREVIDNLMGILKDMQKLEDEFSSVAALTRTQEPDEDASDEVFRAWEDHPLYVLPDSRSVINEAHAAIEKLEREGRL
ncbi:hypothetical protein [Ruegeria arenilitoris]|uniref:hypothetical protein n=1 Tax=Ruegeria arenilitoris TaxID=1173585 RepID=UPI00147EFE56|nr:hypothetical protein [Ruegeria arenilitoris]